MKNPCQPPRPIDSRIWTEELTDFVPQRVMDVHTHLFRWAHYQDPEKEDGPYAAMLGGEFAESGWELAEYWDRTLLPGRQVHRLSFPFPFPHPCDFDAANEFVAGEISRDPHSAALMLVHPGMDVEAVEACLERRGFLGFKPYRFYSITGDGDECRITDFMPESLIEIAHRRQLIIMMHLSRREAVADRFNLVDLMDLCQKYPGSRWILAHCARSYSAWAIEKAARHLRGLTNVWYDTSSVCETDALDALYSGVGPDRVMYGSDDLPVGVARGKYIAFGHAWAYLSETNHSLNLSHCCPDMTFTRYEQLRAMRRAATRLGLSRQQNEAVFHDTASALIAITRGQKEPQELVRK